MRIYLPRHRDETNGKKPTLQAEVSTGRGETILLVEDDEHILKVGKQILEGLGYVVLTASRPEDALKIAGDMEGEIHLLVTDVVMPGMNGRELSNQLRLIRPGLRTLFMSGYTANVIAHRGVLDEGVNFIGKPFTMQDLAAKVRAALDA